MRKSPQDSTKSRTHGQTLSSTWDSWTITLLFKDLFTQCLKTCSYHVYTHVWTLFKTCLHYVETHVYTMLLENMIIPYWKMHLQNFWHFSIIFENMFTTFETSLCHVQRHKLSCMKTCLYSVGRHAYTKLMTFVTNLWSHFHYNLFKMVSIVESKANIS